MLTQTTGDRVFGYRTLLIRKQPSSTKHSPLRVQPLNEPREGRAQGLPLLLTWEAHVNSLHLCFVGQQPLHQVLSHQFRL